MNGLFKFSFMFAFVAAIFWLAPIMTLRRRDTLFIRLMQTRNQSLCRFLLTVEE